MEENDNRTRKYVIVGVIFFVIGFGLSWIIFGRKSLPVSDTLQEEKSAQQQTQESSTPSSTSLTGESALNMNGASMLSVENQIAGSQVTIASLNVEKSVWVAIHEDNAGKPGNVLGAGHFAKVTMSAVVDLLRNTIVGHTYYAMIHIDDGDGKFDLKKDMPLTDSSGAMVMTKFTAE